MKSCSKCKIEKNFSDFSKKKSRPDGLYNYCRVCVKEINQKDYLLKRERIILQNTAYYEANREKILSERRESGKNASRSKEWRDANYEYHLSSKVEYRKNNADKIAEANKKYKASNPETVKRNRDNYRKNNPEKVAARKKAFSSKPLEKIKNRVRKRVWEVLKRNGAVRSKKFEEYIGCTQEELKLHIISLFTPDMTWEALIAGEIHIDHIVPLANATTAEEIYTLCHYTNLQPLWEIDNLRKNKY